MKEVLHAPSITCPYCGYVDKDSWEYRLSDGDSIIVDCSHCDKEFEVFCHVNVTYCSYEKES